MLRARGSDPGKFEHLKLSVIAFPGPARTQERPLWPSPITRDAKGQIVSLDEASDAGRHTEPKGRGEMGL